MRVSCRPPLSTARLASPPYETATFAGEAFAQYELTKRGHRKLAWIVQSVNVGLTAAVVAKSYHLAPAPVGPRVITPR